MEDREMFQGGMLVTDWTPPSKSTVPLLAWRLVQIASIQNHVSLSFLTQLRA